MLDEDGYPTEEALALIEKWSYEDPKGWFNFIKSIWWMRDWGWRESALSEDDTVLCYNVSTGGWSGNESIISAMQQNRIMWSTTWVSSRRGGHYVFELKE